MSDDEIPDDQAEEREMIAKYDIPFYSKVLECFPEISAELRKRILEDVFDQASQDTAWYLHYSLAHHVVDLIEAVFRHQLMDGNSELRTTCLFCVLKFMELHFSESLEEEGFFVAMRKLLRCSLNFPEYNQAATCLESLEQRPTDLDTNM